MPPVRSSVNDPQASRIAAASAARRTPAVAPRVSISADTSARLNAGIE
jgi:hypothetical protein